MTLRVCAHAFAADDQSAAASLGEMLKCFLAAFLPRL